MTFNQSSSMQKLQYFYVIIWYPVRIHDQRTSLAFELFHVELTLVTHHTLVLRAASAFALEVIQILMFTFKIISCATFSFLRFAYLLV